MKRNRWANDFNHATGERFEPLFCDNFIINRDRDILRDVAEIPYIISDALKIGIKYRNRQIFGISFIFITENRHLNVF